MPSDPPSNPIPRCLLGLRPPLTEWVPKPFQAEGSKTAEGTDIGGEVRPYSTLPAMQRHGTPLAPPERQSSLTNLSGIASIPTKLASPFWLSEMPRGEGSTLGRSEASCCGGRGYPKLGESHQLKPSLPSAAAYNLTFRDL